ncbi:hypothetical protein QA596_00995 [Balneolales bacterium ANBcel1]|nr:hypothetical protein [Balneolales bacterium ANBcel1]
MIAILLASVTLTPAVQSAAGQARVSITETLERHDGADFFIHTVRPGQNCFGIARAYRVSPDRVRAINPQCGEGLAAGSTLRIPVTAANQALLAAADEGDRTAVRRSDLSDGELTALETMQLEQQLYEVLTEAINRFFRPEDYMLRIGVEMSVRTLRREVPVAAAPEETAEPEGRLPGLPFVPRDLIRERETTSRVQQEGVEVVETRVPELERMHILVRVDSMLTEQDLELMRETVTSRIDIDPERGDTFELVRRNLRTEEPAVAEAPAPEGLFADSNRLFYLMLAAAVLLALLLALLVWYLMVMLSRKKKKEGRHAVAGGNVHDSIEHEQQMALASTASAASTGFSILHTFNFVHYLSDEQLMELLSSEKERVKALVLSHLPDDRKSGVLKKYGMEEAGRILFSLSQVRNLTFYEYEKIAARLSNRGFQSVGGETQITDRDVEQMAAIIGRMPEMERETYIRQLESLVTELGEKVREALRSYEDRRPELGEGKTVGSE